ncbi:MAG: outer membrane protein assembly factor BamD [Paludibacteraceae bacterium]|nr:outer membrane protein assembly factor BamD [Paludibacteraceae bacterium]
MYNRLFLILLLVVVLSGCSNYSKIQKSTDANLKFNAAKNYFLEKKYTRSIQLLESLMGEFRGTPQAEELLYLLAKSYMATEDYMSASEYFDTYLRNFPRGKFAESSRYEIAYCYYKDSPDVRLDQTATENAIYSFEEYLEYYPLGYHAEDALTYLIEMENKLSYKAYLSAKLYYDIGLYGGNNYRSCIVTAENMLRDYPDSEYRQDALFLILLSKQKEAEMSVDEKKYDRYSELIDECYRYSNEYPDGKYSKEANRVLENARKTIKKLTPQE